MPFRLPGVLSDHMVVQREKPTKIWGWGDPGTQVEVKWADDHATAVVDPKGNWVVTLPPRGAGGPYDLTVRHGGSTVMLRDVLVGEVWVCSGQSNMEWPVERSDDAKSEIASARLPSIRMFNVVKNVSPAPLDDGPGQWLVCDPSNAGLFSAVGYFFARKLHQELNVAVGMLHTSWGGTAAEAWTSGEALDAVPSLKYLADAGKPDRPDQFAVPHIDPGVSPEAAGWEDANLDDSDWSPIKVPGTWQGNGGPNVNGAAWYRNHIDLPSDWAGKDLTLSLGAADDVDDTFFNGQPVGRTTTATPNYWSRLRLYAVPGHLVKAGRNVLSVRVFDQWGSGGLVGPARDMHVSPVGSDQSVPLLTGWLFKVELALPLRNPSSVIKPSRLYNAMLAPLLKAGIRGAIWYQGESNADRAYEYRTLLPTLIRDWRAKFAQGDFPFLIVELANWRERRAEPSPSSWAELREAQHVAAKAVGNSAVACIIELGDADDIHPTNKQDVGLRLALLALHDTYAKSSVVSRGPAFVGMTVENDSIRVRFTHTAGGLTSSDPARGVVGFTIAGEDQVFVRAEAKIDGNDVIVRAPGLKKPVAVRYAWADNPDCTLFNSAVLPAYPFRTDAWRGMTEPPAT